MININIQNLSNLVRYANVHVKKLRKNNVKMTRFHWSGKWRDNGRTSSGQGLIQLTAWVMSTWVRVCTRLYPIS